MKNIIITLSILLAGCDTHKPSNGVYTYGNTWLIFTGSPAEFKSLSRAHMGFYGYSAGNVIRDRNQVILNEGFELKIFPDTLTIKNHHKLLRPGKLKFKKQ